MAKRYRKSIGGVSVGFTPSCSQQLHCVIKGAKVVTGTSDNRIGTFCTNTNDFITTWAYEPVWNSSILMYDRSPYAECGYAE